MVKNHIRKGGFIISSQNYNISCSVCQDLIPLVKDDVASEDSRNLVYDHISTCSICHDLYSGLDETKSDDLNDYNNLLRIKKRIYFFGLTLIAMGGLLGIYLSNSMNMFYNFIIMPFVGALGYILWRKRWYLVPLGIFCITYLWLLIGYIFENNGFTTELFPFPFFLSFIYSILTIVGVLICALLKFAFYKEDHRNESKKNT